MRHLVRLTGTALTSSSTQLQSGRMTHNNCYGFAKKGKKGESGTGKNVSVQAGQKKRTSVSFGEKMEAEKVLQKQQEDQLLRLLSIYKTEPTPVIKKKPKAQKKGKVTEVVLETSINKTETKESVVIIEKEPVRYAEKKVKGEAKSVDESRIISQQTELAQQTLSVQKLCQQVMSFYAQQYQQHASSCTTQPQIQLNAAEQASVIPTELPQSTHISEMFQMDLPQLKDDAQIADLELTEEEYLEEDYAVLQLQRQIKQAELFRRPPHGPF